MSNTIKKQRIIAFFLVLGLIAMACQSSGNIPSENTVATTAPVATADVHSPADLSTAAPVFVTSTPEVGSVANVHTADYLVVEEERLVDTSTDESLAIQTTQEGFGLDVNFGEHMKFPVQFLLNGTSEEGKAMWTLVLNGETFLASEGNIFAIYHDELFVGAIILTKGSVARAFLPYAYEPNEIFVIHGDHEVQFHYVTGEKLNVALTLSGGQVLFFDGVSFEKQ